ncbi:MAG: glycoside hydrolase domain-containing protein [bacterium]
MQRNKIKLYSLFLICLLSLNFFNIARATGTINGWVVDANVKIRPQAGQGSGQSFAIEGARNETVSLQFAISPIAETLNNVDVSVSLQGGFVSTIYREGFMHVITPSNRQGDTGEWPDIMIPKVDAFYGQTRNAFPTTINNISQAYPFINAAPDHTYGPSGGYGWDTSEFYISKKIPDSGFVWPYDGMQQATGLSYVHNIGTGKVITSGTYTGSAKSRYIVVIDSAGAVGVATFKWSADNGATFTAGVTTSIAPISLGNGINVSFAGAGLSSDFALNDEWIFYVAATRNQPVWVDIYIPKNISAGVYSGSINISADGKEALIMPINLTVDNFILPDTSSLKNIFYGYGNDIPDGHKLNRNNHIDQLYVADGLRHRISMSRSINMNANGVTTVSCSSYEEDTGNLVMDYSSYDNYMTPFMDGTGTTYFGGAVFSGKFTSIMEPNFTIAGCANANASLYLQRVRADFVTHLKTKGWFDRFYIYNNTMDEPGSNQSLWNGIIAYGSAWRSAASDVPLMVTGRMDNATTAGAASLVDDYVSVSRQEIAANNPEAPNWRYTKSNYSSFIDLISTPKKDVWWYSACFEAGGCGNPGGTFYNNFANISAIDSTALQNVIRPWLTRYYDYHGDLYYDVTDAWNKYASQNLDPWDTSYNFGVNGDGQLFYPGRPDKIGGSLDIPLESLRLKLIRNGMQNYEYMNILDQLGEQNYVNVELSTIMSNVQVFTADPLALAQVRKNFAEKIKTVLLSSDVVAPSAPAGLNVL